jgi:hypothetical protein
MAIKMLLDQCYSCGNECKKQPLKYKSWKEFLYRTNGCKKQKYKRLTSNGISHMGLTSVAINHNTPNSITG